MSLYQFLAAVCDGIHWILVAANLHLIGYFIWKRHTRRALRASGCLAFALTVTYGLYFIDLWLGLWPAVGGDYSTHTAFVLAMATPLVLCNFWRFAAVLVTVFYGVLMVVQQYHSIFDVITTTAVYLLLFGVALVTYRRVLG